LTVAFFAEIKLGFTISFHTEADIACGSTEFFVAAGYNSHAACEVAARVGLLHLSIRRPCKRVLMFPMYRNGKVL
jgi:hypothetical protein